MGSKDSLPALTNRSDAPTVRRLTDLQLQGLANVPPQIEWFANIDNPRTRHGSSVEARPVSRKAIRVGAPVASQQSRILRADDSSVTRSKGVRKVLAQLR